MAVQRYAMLIAGAVVGAICLIALGLLVNCLVWQRSCPQTGILRETLEDAFAFLMGLIAGRSSKP